MPRRLVYPKQFLKSVPPPEQWDRRPLPNLLHPIDPVTGEQECERIERWYREMNSKEKTHLKRQLRSMRFREYWSAYHELITARIARSFGALSIRHAAVLAGRRPDFTVTFSSGTQIWEVATAYQTLNREADDDKAHELARRLNSEFKHRWRVVVEAERFGPGGVSLSKAIPKIQAWLDRLDAGGPVRITLRPPIINCDLSLRAHRPGQSAEPRPIVSALMGQGGNVTATDQLKNVLRKKIRKYGSVKAKAAPLIVFLYEGNWLHISRESLENALLGELLVTFRVGRKAAPLSLAPGGLFLPGPDGRHQNTRLSAVVYGRREWRDGAPHARLFVYHHPAAQHPVPLEQFESLAQCRITIGDTDITQQWTAEPDGEIQTLPLT
ncbi:MAG: hypothetical protein GDA68_17935 [Nitrospira sp. CR2.1]|nr:hypothetical protein [Nitrospira sp. CR2.1]MBA5875464.1 hypothetical protein [Nitrospira sp. CR1.2]